MSQVKTKCEKNQDHGIQPNTAWQIKGETVEIASDFLFLGSEIIVAVNSEDDCFLTGK